jgi:hypothetical protein
LIKKQERTLPNSFYESSITLILKLDKNIVRKENGQAPVAHTSLATWETEIWFKANMSK